MSSSDSGCPSATSSQREKALNQTFKGLQVFTTPALAQQLAVESVDASTAFEDLQGCSKSTPLSAMLNSDGPSQSQSDVTMTDNENLAISLFLKAPLTRHPESSQKFAKKSNSTN
jgi:hypothetical protein